MKEIFFTIRFHPHCHHRNSLSFLILRFPTINTNTITITNTTNITTDITSVITTASINK